MAIDIFFFWTTIPLLYGWFWIGVGSVTSYRFASVYSFYDKMDFDLFSAASFYVYFDIGVLIYFSMSNLGDFFLW